MRYAFASVIAALALVQAAAAQTPAPDTVPREIGNRANGFNYQPTPSEVLPRERAAGVRPPISAEDATNRDLESIDRTLLHEEGDSSSGVPKFQPR